MPFWTKFWIATKFAFNIYILTAFITLCVLGIINILKKCTEKK